MPKTNIQLDTRIENPPHLASSPHNLELFSQNTLDLRLSSKLTTDPRLTLRQCPRSTAFVPSPDIQKQATYQGSVPTILHDLQAFQHLRPHWAFALFTSVEKEASSLNLLPQVLSLPAFGQHRPETAAHATSYTIRSDDGLFSIFHTDHCPRVPHLKTLSTRHSRSQWRT